MILFRPLPVITLVSTAFALTSCASLGGNVKGDFLCRAPGGSCAPSTVIDDQALAQIGEARPLPASQTSPWNMPRQQRPQIAEAGNGVVNTPPRVTQVVFPAFVDSEGYLHEARKVKMVSQAGGWVQMAESTPNPVSQSRELSQANTALSGFKLVPEPVAISTSMLPSDSGIPTADAVAQARQKALVKQPMTPDEIKSVVEAKLGSTPAAPPTVNENTPVNAPKGFSGKAE